MGRQAAGTGTVDDADAQGVLTLFAFSMVLLITACADCCFSTTISASATATFRATTSIGTVSLG